MLITVNGQPVPIHASHGQIVALFPSGVLGLRDPMGVSVLPNSDGSIDFSVAGDYYLPIPRRDHSTPPAYDAHGLPRHDPWDQRPSTPRMTQSYHRQSVSPGNTEGRSPVLLTPMYPGTGPAERRPVVRSHWNSDTHVEHDDPELIFDKNNRAMGSQGHGYILNSAQRHTARGRYRYRPQAAAASPPSPPPETRKAVTPQRMYNPGYMQPRQRSHTPPVTVGVGSRRSASPPPPSVPSSQRSPPRRETPPLNITRYMQLKYGYNALTDGVLKGFPGHNCGPSGLQRATHEKVFRLFARPKHT